MPLLDGLYNIVQVDQLMFYVTVVQLVLKMLLGRTVREWVDSDVRDHVCLGQAAIMQT